MSFSLLKLNYHNCGLDICLNYCKTFTKYKCLNTRLKVTCNVHVIIQ